MVFFERDFVEVLLFWRRDNIMMLAPAAATYL